MDFVALLMILLFAGVAYWAAHRIEKAFSIPSQIMVLVDILIVVAALLALIRAFGFGGRLGL